jgi:hypothetical protein
MFDTYTNVNVDTWDFLSQANLEDIDIKGNKTKNIVL